MKFNPDQDCTIFSGELLDAKGETVAHFSSHAAAWEVLQRLRNDGWSAWGPSVLTERDHTVMRGLQ